MSSFISISVFKVYFVWYEYCYSSFLLISICVEHFFPSHQFQSICLPRSDVGLIDSIYVSCFHSTLNPERIIRFEFVAIFFRIDFICSGLMVWASGSMVVFLHNHKQRIQHIHSNSHSSRTSAEARATSNIFVLVNSFFIIYSLSSLLSIWMSLFAIPGQWLVDTSIFLSLCFPTVSPFVLICSAIRIIHNIFASSSRQGKHFLLIWQWPLDSILYKISNYFPLTINIWLTNIFRFLIWKQILCWWEQLGPKIHIPIAGLILWVNIYTINLAVLTSLKNKGVHEILI